MKWIVSTVCCDYVNLAVTTDVYRVVYHLSQIFVKYYVIHKTIFEIVDEPVRVCQLKSGNLKYPSIVTCGFAWSTKYMRWLEHKHWSSP